MLYNNIHSYLHQPFIVYTLNIEKQFLSFLINKFRQSLRSCVIAILPFPPPLPYILPRFFNNGQKRVFSLVPQEALDVRLPHWLNRFQSFSCIETL